MTGAMMMMMMMTESHTRGLLVADAKGTVACSLYVGELLECCPFQTTVELVHQFLPLMRPFATYITPLVRTVPCGRRVATFLNLDVPNVPASRRK